MDSKSVADRTIFLTVYGSRAYGFSNPDSDWDYRGVCIPPLSQYVSINAKFEQCLDKDLYKHYPDGLLVTDPKPDMQVMEICKFASLAAHGNPSVLEIMFTDESLHVISHPIMKKLLDNRDLFLSQRVRYSFHGYAISQLKRIKTHRSWLLNPVETEPTREQFGLPEIKVDINNNISAAISIIHKQVQDLDVPDILSKELQTKYRDSISRILESTYRELNSGKYPVGPGDKYESVDDVLFTEKARSYGFDDNMIDILGREKRYKAAKASYDSYMNWKANRNKDRASNEAKFGYDTKHAVHLIRLIRMCKELIQDGKLLVSRPDADELREIRNGKLSFDEVIEIADNSEKEIAELMKTTKLPKVPSLKKIDKIVFEMVKEYNE